MALGSWYLSRVLCHFQGKLEPNGPSLLGQYATTALTLIYRDSTVMQVSTLQKSDSVTRNLFHLPTTVLAAGGPSVWKVVSPVNFFDSSGIGLCTSPGN